VRQPELPNNKQVLTDSIHGLVRLSLPGANSAWPDGDGGVAIRNGIERETLVAPFSRLGLAMPRERIRNEHRRWTLGLLFFLQNDAAVPASFRAECATWGLPADEFRDTVHFPEQPVVSEARRMVARRIFTQQDTGPAENDVRSVFSRESIALSDSPLCSQLTHIEGSSLVGRGSGGFEVWGPPVQIPMGVLLPRHVDNLIVTCAVGASHVGVCALHSEPVRMALGEAAGHVAFLANAAKRSIHRVHASTVQRRLHAEGSATLYLSDVPPGHPDFQAFQWWGSIGGFHGLEARSTSLRGAPLPDGAGAPFFEAFPGHAAEPDSALPTELAKRWALIAQAAGIDASQLRNAEASRTRADWIRAAYQIFLKMPVQD
jgi:hypothetical protein